MATQYKIEAKTITGRWSLLKADTHPADLTDDELVAFACEEAKSLPVARSLYVRWRVARMDDATFTERIFEREFANP